MIKPFFTLFFLSFLLIFNTHSQTPFRVMFYNVENFFDMDDNPVKNDDDFLPEGNRHWTYGRYTNKMNNLAKVIASIGEWSTPAIIGLCEVENDKVMTGLTQYSPLKSQKYEYIITQCNDTRGINTAFMYQRDQFRYIGHRAYSIYFAKNPSKKTRDILHVTGKVQSGDTLDVFICHFPSRRGGEQISEPDRIQSAQTLKNKTDSVRKSRKNACILIMGDFNDEPNNKSLQETLGAKPPGNKNRDNALYNLYYHFVKQQNKGSYKFGRQWNVLDQMIVSGNLLDRESNFHVLPETVTIFDEGFLLVDDKTNGGKRPKKTYHGMKHEGGFSDHLPIFTDFFISSPQK